MENVLLKVIGKKAKNLYYGYSALKPGYCIIILKFYDTNTDHFFDDIFIRFFFCVIFPGFGFYDISKKIEKKPVKISKKTLEIFQFFKRSQNTIRSFFSF